jgi:hypothetical protein
VRRKSFHTVDKQSSLHQCARVGGEDKVTGRMPRCKGG